MTITPHAIINQQGPLGASVPPFTPHALSVSFPSWTDNVGYINGEKRVVDNMLSGYPRFVIPLNVQALAKVCQQRFGVAEEQALLCPSRRIAEHCAAFFADQSPGSPIATRLVDFTVRPAITDPPTAAVVLYIVFYPPEAQPLAKTFWQHTGLGISSRWADLCLCLLGEETSTSKHFVLALAPHAVRIENGLCNAPTASRERTSFSASAHYDKGNASAGSGGQLRIRDDGNVIEGKWGDADAQLTSGAEAKREIRRRIADLVSRDSPSPCSLSNGTADAKEPTTRGGRHVAEDDVFLFPTGMSAIWHAHQTILGVKAPVKSVCFGFPYCDTVKIMEKWGPGCYFYGHAGEEDLAELERVLQDERKRHPSIPPISALFTEFPSNPRLRSPDLSRLRELADEYDFPIIVDETIGNFVNVNVLPYVDVVVSSLSKIFSGAANVMGGSLVFNPNGTHYDRMMAHLTAIFEDTYFDEDALHMEYNSRDFPGRIAAIDNNALAVCEYLRSRSVAFTPPGADLTPDSASRAIKDIFYPKWVTPENYDICRRRDGGYGGLLTLTFVSMAASHAFYNALPCAKGPSLGTNFTLSCPYTILAHYWELEWAAGWGVEEGIVRISVGLEERETLMGWMETAVEAAEAVVSGTMDV